MDKLFPPEERIFFERKVERPYKQNSIMFANILIYGGQGDGKSELMRFLTEKAVEKYGEDRLSAVNVIGNVENSFKYGIEDKPIAIIYLDDMTKKKVEDDTINQFNRIRHIMMKHADIDQGLIITCLATHSYFQLQKDFRTNHDAILFRRRPENDSDRRWMEKQIGENATKLVGQWTKDRWEERKNYDKTIFSWKMDTVPVVGMMSTPMAEKDYVVYLDFNPETGEKY